MKKAVLKKFRAVYLARLINLRKTLLEKYPDRRDRIEYICDTLENDLNELRTHTLAHYLHIVYQAYKEFPEFSEMIPSGSEVEELLKSRTCSGGV